MLRRKLLFCISLHSLQIDALLDYIPLYKCMLCFMIIELWYNNTVGSKYAIVNHNVYISSDEQLNCSKRV